MKRNLVVLTVISLAVAQSAAAATRPEARRAEAAGLLKEAVRTGTADAAAFATIADWILNEKEEKVAAGLADALGAVGPAIAGREGERWNPTAKAMLGLFTGLLRDAQANRRVDSAEADARLKAVIAAATPAVTEALREAGLDACVVDAAASALKKIENEQP